MLSRRDFLNSAAGSGLALATPATQPASAHAPVPQPARRRLIVESRSHMWLAQSPDRPWPAEPDRRRCRDLI